VYTNRLKPTETALCEIDNMDVYIKILKSKPSGLHMFSAD